MNSSILFITLVYASYYCVCIKFNIVCFEYCHVFIGWVESVGAGLVNQNKIILQLWHVLP